VLRVAVSVEGATERAFVSSVLYGHLFSRGIVAVAVNIEGNVSVERVVSEIKDLFYTYNRVTTLYDLYGFKKRQGRSAKQLEDALREGMTTEDERRRFLPYIQQYEFEALLYSSPAAVANEFLEQSKIPEMEETVRKHDGAENINDGRDTCPSRRLKTMFPSYDKTLHGPALCQKIGLATLRDRCPRFGAWIHSLESLCP
jgi:hypothetical protein